MEIPPRIAIMVVIGLAVYALLAGFVGYHLEHKLRTPRPIVIQVVPVPK
jgi:hypothetical protein